MKLIVYFFIVIGWLLFIFIVSNTEKGPAEVKMREHLLKNGLKILMIVDNSSPIVVARENIKVGSIHEGLGYTGGAHFLEHMMFKGTEIFGTTNFSEEQKLFQKEDILVKNIREEKANGDNFEDELGKLRIKLNEFNVINDLWSVLGKEGAVGTNAFTSYDRTCYMYSIPSNKLEMFFFIESDRMQNLALREFYTEIGAVLEERRMRLENSPSGLLNQKIMRMIFEGTPYSRVIIGDPDDIKNFTRDQVMEYYHTYYPPNNAVIVLAGDIDPPKVIELAEKYFGSMKRREVPELDPASFDSPKQTKEKRAYVNYPASDRAVIGYRTVPASNKDTIVLDFISELLSRGKSSKFYKSLTEKQIVNSVGSYNSSMRYGGNFNILFDPVSGYGTQDVEKIIYGEIEKLKNGEITEQEMVRIKKLLKIDCLRVMESLSSLADNAGYYETICGDWRKFDDFLPNMEKITVDDVIRVSNKYFVSENRSVVILKDSRKEQK